MIWRYKMMKKMWNTPRTVVQSFEPNEYVAVCWGVACSTGSANDVEKKWIIGGPFWDPENNYENGQTHSIDYCGQTSHQWLVDSDNNNVAESMTEINTNGLGNLPCTVYTNDRYTTPRDISTVHAGDYIYWTTTSGNRTWHHQGRVSNTVPGHPNRS